MKKKPSSTLIASLLATALVAGLAAPLHAESPADAWVGTWKLDLAKSHLSGDTFTYTASKNGGYHFSDGTTADYDFRIDGKEYPSFYDRTTTWTAVGERAWDSVTKEKGTVLATIHRELSADGKTLTVTATGTHPDGSAFREESVYQRQTGTKGLVGTWRSTKSDAGVPPGFVVSAPTPGVLHWEVPAWKASTEGTLDGLDHPVTGPTMAPGMTYGNQRISATKLSYAIKYQGKIDTQGIETLAADGRSFTDESWTPGKEKEKSSAWYVKQ